MDTLEQLMFKVPFFSFGMVTVEKCFCGFVGDFPEVSIEGGYRRSTAGYFALSRRLLGSPIVLDISQKRSIAVFLKSKIAIFA